MPEMFTDEHALDYSSPLIFDEYDDDFLEVESDAENVYDDPFDSKGEKIKESKLLINELDLPCDLPPFEYDSFVSQDFFRVDALPSTNNEDKVFNPVLEILILLSMNLFSSKKFPGLRRLVKNKREKDKIGTKLDQIKKKREAWRSPKKSKAVTVNKNSFDCPPASYHPPHPTYETYSGDTCGDDSHFGYDCPPQFSLNYEPEPGYIL
nr:hypothetical protein [Tanacetum cinerariifolium]